MGWSNVQDEKEVCLTEHRSHGWSVDSSAEVALKINGLKKTKIINSNYNDMADITVFCQKGPSKKI
jgi:hypothetical protein